MTTAEADEKARKRAERYRKRGERLSTAIRLDREQLRRIIYGISPKSKGTL